MEDHEFWRNKWEEGDTAWNKDVVEPLLVKHYPQLTDNGDRVDLDVFVPLCGTTLDMIWLAEQGASVVGCELSDLAAKQFFTDNKIAYTKKSDDNFTIYEATDKRIKYLVGDIFQCSIDNVGSFDAVWDQNSLVALNLEDRERYVTLMKSLLKPKGKILLTTFEYDQSCYDISKSPHTIPPSMVKSLYEKFNFIVNTIDTVDLTKTPFTKLLGVPWATKFTYLIFL